MKIKISEKFDNEKRAVYIDENPEPDYFVEEDELQEFLRETRYGHWSNNSQKGIGLGQKLYNLLNRNNGQIQQALDEYTTSKLELFFYLTLPPDLTEIPFELLYDHEFISLKPNVHFVRLVSEKTATLRKENKPLKILFVAASPTDLEHATLQFEQEEENIFKVTEKYPLNFQVEDTGSLAGIEQMLYEIQGADILHISGHAGHDAELGPVFYMEDEFGNLDKVTPDRLFKYIKDSCPKILFLSGCSTGKSDKYIGVESFAYQIVQMGVSYVLSWGLPVSDKGATAFAAVVYEKLARGKSIAYAIQEARISVKEKYHPWPLMRLFTDGTKCEALVEEGQKTIRKSSRQTIHKNLKGSNVKILDKGFVGRRRELQKALKVLRNREPYENKYGMIIRGPAGVGKSCLAGRIFERQSIYDIFILRGALDRKMIIHELKKYFDKEGYQEALGILGSDRTYEEKIKELYRTIFKEKNVIIYFDDFEDNLELQKNTWYLNPEFINNFRPFLQYIYFTDNQSKISITSRYAFDLQAEGENLSNKFLLDIPLMSLRGPDENKKLNELEHIAKSNNFELFKKFGHGNPRLMDWLDKIAADEKKYNLEELQKALEGKEEDYIREYLAEIMAKAEGSEFWQFLQMAAVYRLPVLADAFEKFGGKKLLEKGVDLTLFEKEAVSAEEERYWVMPVIRQQMWQQLDSEQQKKAHKTALTWYDQFLEANDIIPYHNEALYHALAVNEIDLAAKHVIPIGNELNRLLYYQEQKEILEGVRSRLTKKLISEAKKNKKQSISGLLNQYANLLINLGDAKKAVEYLEQALEIDLAVFGDKHPNVATRYNNLGMAYQDLGDAKKAVEYLEQALEIVIAVYGKTHPYFALIYNNLDSAYKDLGDAVKGH
jgi:tetratricopeptide (TPR) repeat protein